MVGEGLRETGMSRGQALANFEAAYEAADNDSRFYYGYAREDFLIDNTISVRVIENATRRLIESTSLRRS